MTFQIAVFSVVMILIGIALSKPIKAKWGVVVFSLIVGIVVCGVYLYHFKQPEKIAFIDSLVLVITIIVYRFYLSDLFAAIRQNKEEETEQENKK